MSNLTKKAVRGVFIVFFFSIIGSLFGYASRVFLANKLSVADFGLFFAVFALVQYLEFFRSLGLSTAIVKFTAEYKALMKFDMLKTILYVAIGIILSTSLIIVFILIVSSNYLAVNYFKTSKALPIILVLSAWFFIRGVQDTIFVIFYGFQKIFLYCLRELRSVFYLIILVILFIFNSDVLFYSLV